MSALIDIVLMYTVMVRLHDTARHGTGAGAVHGVRRRHQQMGRSIKPIDKWCH